jgi:hypothetical protein
MRTAARGDSFILNFTQVAFSNRSGAQWSDGEPVSAHSNCRQLSSVPSSRAVSLRGVYCDAAPRPPCKMAF